MSDDLKLRKLALDAIQDKLVGSNLKDYESFKPEYNSKIVAVSPATQDALNETSRRFSGNTILNQIKDDYPSLHTNIINEVEKNSTNLNKPLFRNLRDYLFDKEKLPENQLEFLDRDTRSSGEFHFKKGMKPEETTIKIFRPNDVLQGISTVGHEKEHYKDFLNKSMREKTPDMWKMTPEKFQLVMDNNPELAELVNKRGINSKNIMSKLDFFNDRSDKELMDWALKHPAEYQEIISTRHHLDPKINRSFEVQNPYEIIKNEKPTIQTVEHIKPKENVDVLIKETTTPVSQAREVEKVAADMGSKSGKITQAISKIGKAAKVGVKVLPIVGLAAGLASGDASAAIPGMWSEDVGAGSDDVPQMSKEEMGRFHSLKERLEHEE